MKLPIIGVMGSGTEPCSARAEALGGLLARMPVHLLTGGGGGVMRSVSEHFVATPGRQGLVIGVLPARADDPLCTPKPGYPNPFVEIVIRTHLPLSGDDGTAMMSRNHINVLSSDAIVVLPGSAGTASEVRLSRRYQRPVFGFLEQGEMPELDQIERSASIADVEFFLAQLFE